MSVKTYYEENGSVTKEYRADEPGHRCPRCDEPNPERLDLDGCRDPDCPEQEAGRSGIGPTYDAHAYYKSSVQADSAAGALRIAFRETVKAREAVKFAMDNEAFPAPVANVLVELHEQLMQGIGSIDQAIAEIGKAAMRREDEEWG